VVTITNLGTSVVGYNDLNDISMSRTFGEMVMCGVSMSRDIQVNVGLTLAEITFFFSLIYNNRDSQVSTGGGLGINHLVNVCRNESTASPVVVLG